MKRPNRPASRLEPVAAKVPEITVLFWLIKVLTTGMGEAISDFLGQQSIPIAGALGIIGFGLAMRLQFAAREYRATVYWFAVLMVAVFGTMAADGVHEVAPYAVTTPLLGIAVGVTFWLWHRAERTLSIHSIVTRRRETFYWTAVLATFALGTAAGDLTAITLNLGYFGSLALFGALIALPGLAWWRGLLNPTVAFWTAYVLTRPLGASLADGFSKPHLETGLGLGDGTVSVFALVVFAGLVAYAAVTRRDVQDPAAVRV